MTNSTTSLACPDRAALELFVADGEHDASVSAHVVGCEACGRIVATIRDENAFLRANVPPDAGVRVRAAKAEFQIRGYDIVREIHRGGQGVVYHAVQRSTRRDVAVKVLRAGPFAGLSDRARFDREVQVLAQLNHPNIVTIHDSGIADGSHYFVMDFVRGLALDDYLAGPGQSLDVRARLELFAEICEAVNAAHLRGVIHRDLKPSNIMVGEEGTEARRDEGPKGGRKAPMADASLRASVSAAGGGLRASPKILDFGLAKLASTDGQPSMMTLTGHFVGTPQWASPEQLSGGGSRLDLRSDVYSLGVILYQMLTGAFPYDVQGPWHEVASRIQRVEPDRLRRSGRSFDNELETIVLKCLSKEPARRYETAGALARDLRRYLAGEAIDAKRESAWYVIRKAVRRYRLAIGLAAAAIVTLIGFSAAMSIAYQRARSAEQSTAQRSTELATALVRANIEQGRALGLLGSVPGAEDLLWRELLTSSNATPGIRSTDPACWALLELYARYPCRATYATFPVTDIGVRLAFEPESGLLLLAARSGAVEWRELLSGRLVDHVPADPRRASSRGVTWTQACDVLSESGGSLLLYSPRARSARALGPQREVTSAGLDMSSDCRQLAIGDAVGGVLLFDVPAEGPARERVRIDVGHKFARRIKLLTARNALLSAGDDDQLRMWDLASDPPRLVWSRAALGQSAIAVSADERLVAFQTPNGETVSWVRIEDGAEVGSSSERMLAMVGVTEFSPDVSQILVAVNTRSELRLFDVATGASRGVLLGHRALVDEGRFSTDGRLIASKSVDNVVKIWQPTAVSRAVSRIDHDASVMGVAFTPDGASLLQADGAGLLRRTRLSDGAAEFEHVAHVAQAVDIVLMPGQSRFASSGYDGTIHIWDLAEGNAQPVATFHADTKVNQIAFHPSGRWLAATRDDADLDIWDIESGTSRRLADHQARVATLACSGDGRWLASGDASGRLIIRDASDFSIRADVQAAHLRVLRTLAFSPDSQTLATGGDDGLIHLWDPATGTRAQTIAGHENSVFSLAYRPDGRVIASGDTAGTIVLWDAASRRNLAQFKPHQTMIFCLAFSPDGTCLASGSGDRTCVIHDFSRLESYIAGNLEAAIARPHDPAASRAEALRRWAKEEVGSGK